MTTDAAPPSTPASRTAQEPPARKRRRWLLVGVAGWAVLLLLVAYVSVRTDAPTVPEQRDVVAAMPVVNRALGRLLSGAGPDAVAEIGGQKLEPGCRISPMRDGFNLVGTLTLRTAEADAPALLDRIAERLPAEYHARVRHRPESGTHTLRADGGEFVLISGGVTDPGVIELTAETGCRPGSDTQFVDTLMGIVLDDEAVRVLTALGLPAPEFADDRPTLYCPSGGHASTTRVTVPGTPTAPLGTTLRPVAGPASTVVTDEPDLYAYRTASLSVVVTLTETGTRVSTTTPCP
ncbi:hypothetical protein [Micromonospora pisi]|uniref:hypothetical protein n=1 Tax=Micromonospora pisi TaxID=589240 RepID=UPI0011C34F05|nr:hypothetical protein [Micromonospora pisi]